MIDILKAEKAFKEYLIPYDINNPKIKIKIAHTYRTVEVAKKIAESLNLEEEDVQLACLIGLLHDIGRFEQLRIYDTFDDNKSIDHADFSVKVLFEDGIIKEFIEDRQYDDIIYKAIKNHNKYEIEEGLNERELLHAKLIRDADKTDIYVVHVDDILNNRGVLYHNNDDIKDVVTPEVLNDFVEHKSVRKVCCKNRLDDLIVVLSFVYNFYFSKGLEIISEGKYIEILLQQLERYAEKKEEIELIENTITNFLKNRIAK